MFPPLVTRDLEMNGPNQNWKNGDGRMSKQRAAYCCPRSSPCSPLRADRRGRGERTREVQRPRPRAADPASAPPSALCPHGASGSSLWDKSRRREIPSAWAAREEEKATSVGRGNLPTKALRVHGKAGEGIHRRPPSSTRGAPLAAVRPEAASATRRPRRRPDPPMAEGHGRVTALSAPSATRFYRVSVSSAFRLLFSFMFFFFSLPLFNR